MNLLKNLSIYTFISFLGGLIGLLLMPVLTHYLSPKDYGILSLFNTYVLITIPIIGFSANGLISVELFNKDLEKKHFASLFTSISIIPIVPFFIAIIGVFFFSTQLESLLEIPAEFIFLIPTLALFTIYSEQLFNYLVFTKKILIYSISNISKLFGEVLLTVFFVITLGMHWQGRIESWLITLTGVLIFSIYFFISNKLLIWNIKVSHIKSGIIYGSPLIIHNIGKLVVHQSDRIFIANMVSLDETGIYNTGYMIGSILLIVSGAFIKIYTPYLFERLSNFTEKKGIEIVRISYLFMTTLIIILLLTTLFAPLFYKYFIDPRYEKGVLYVFWIGLSYFFWGGYLIFAGFLFYKKKTIILAILAILNILLNLLFNYFFILQYGTIGAAYATSLSFFIILLIVAFIANRMYRMPWFKFKLIAKGE